jgi:hypothetical protein
VEQALYQWECYFQYLDPYIDITIGFYGYFVAFAIGTVVGGFLFDKKYLSDGE